MINLRKDISMKSELIKHIGTHYLLSLKTCTNHITQYVVCSNYQPEAKFGSQWDWGHYFWNDNYAGAYKCLLKLEGKI